MQFEPEKLPDTLLHSIDNDYAKQELINLSDSLLDNTVEALLNSDATSKLPIVGWIVATSKGAFDVRDRLYVRKLLRVLAETGGASQKDKEKWQRKLDAKPEEAKKAGATILDLIDKATSAEKAAMIGKVIRAFMHEDDLTTDEMIALCEMIDKAYLDDLKALARPDGENGQPWNDANLEAVGIMKPIRVEDINKAVQALNSRLLKQMPRIHEGPINDEAEPEVIQSGFTDAGARLRGILRDY